MHTCSRCETSIYLLISAYPLNSICIKTVVALRISSDHHSVLSWKLSLHLLKTLFAEMRFVILLSFLLALAVCSVFCEESGDEEVSSQVVSLQGDFSSRAGRDGNSSKFRKFACIRVATLLWLKNIPFRCLEGDSKWQSILHNELVSQYLLKLRVQKLFLLV